MVQRYLMIEEELSKEDIEEGLEPETFNLKVNFSKHSMDRMEDDFGRQADIEDVMDLLYSKKAIVNQALNSTFTVLRNDHKLAVVCALVLDGRDYVLEVITVVRKTYIDKFGYEVEKKVKVSGKVLV